ncbi:MAG: hypothetical protein PVJ72_14525 [Gammaproteobacteria bacterium]|jgi:hypothetical protein
MSYLSNPRIHFAGAFFTNPSNLNNLTSNYKQAADDQPLTYDTGKYNNPTGVAQFYFRDCVVTQTVGEDGLPIGNDELLNAAVDTVNTWDEQTDPQGNNYVLAKIADLDPDMQFRTEIYGLRIFVKSANGYGFSGAIKEPQLRDLFFGRGSGDNPGLQIACGTWHQRIIVDQWQIPQSGKSPVLDLLSANGVMELDIKLSVDMFQTDPQQQFSVGNRYCYGRLLATIGPVAENDPYQIVPGRRLYSSLCFAGMEQAQGQPNILTRHGAEECVEKGEHSVQGGSQQAPFWNNTDARVVTRAGNTILLIDMGTSTPLKAQSNGVFDIGSDLQIGYLDTNNNFVAFANQGYTVNGSLATVSQQLQDYVTLSAANQYRDSCYLKNAGVVQLSLTTNEAAIVEKSSLCIQSDSLTVLKENPGGYYANFEMAACRMQPNETSTSANQPVILTAYMYGKPMTVINKDLFSVQFTPQVLSYDQSGKNPPTPVDTTIFSAEVSSMPVSGKPGQFAMNIKTGPGQPLDNNSYRKPMDSQLCFLKATSVNVLIGENQYMPFPLYIPAVAILFWQNQWISNNPTWAGNIGPILSIYGKLYPGMKGILDISDEATVKSFAKGMYHRFNLDIQDPAFMPVVRDMSPATLNMMKTWLQQQYSSQAGEPA